MKLSQTQQEVFERTKDEWLTAYDLQASLSTLNALVKYGLLDKRGVGSLGSMYSPRNTVQYRRKRQTDAQQ